MEYNGWANYETWNVALWIQNDESLNGLALSCCDAVCPYDCFRSDLRDVWGDEAIGLKTPDGVNWYDKSLDLKALNEFVKELSK